MYEHDYLLDVLAQIGKILFHLKTTIVKVFFPHKPWVYFHKPCTFPYLYTEIKHCKWNCMKRLFYHFLGQVQSLGNYLLS